MAYLGKNINMTLVLVIIGVVIALLGITVFFQLGLEKKTTARSRKGVSATATRRD